MKVRLSLFQQRMVNINQEHKLFFCSKFLFFLVCYCERGNDMKRETWFKRENVWFGTLFILLVALSILYVVIPTDQTFQVTKDTPEDDSKVEEVSGDVVTVMESDAITAMQVARDEELDTMIATANETINNAESSIEEKNNAYEEMKNITDIKTLEDELEKLIQDTYQVANFIKISSDQIEVVVATTSYDATLANNIMRTIQERFDKHMYITVKFEI